MAKIEITDDSGIYVFVQARMDSRRFYGKALMDLAGKPILAWVCERAMAVHPKIPVVVLTGDLPGNVPIINWCGTNGIKCFAGDEDDVLKRFCDAAKKNQAKTVIRFTADNPLVDYGLAALLLKRHLTKGSDYSSSKTEIGSGLPIGIGAEIFAARILFRMGEMGLGREHREHVNDYILENRGGFSVDAMLVRNDHARYSFTVDTSEDHARVSEWIKSISPGKSWRPDYWKNVVKKLSSDEDKS